jgi:cysteine desulfurase
MLRLPVYMDNHATTPCDPVVLDAMMPYFTRQFGNASSRGYLQGWQAAEAVQIAREMVASLIHSEPEEIIFTSGATESINLALKGVFESLSPKGKHIITIATEHRAVLDTCLHLEKMGADVTRLPVSADGLADPELLRTEIRPDTILIAVMHSNNETGVLQSVKTIGEIAKEKGVVFFTDATQSLGKVSVDVNRDKIDLLAGSAHKFFGPKGVGFLFVRRKNPRVRLTAQLDGGQQERGLRSGTVNVPGIVGLGKAAELVRDNMNKDMLYVRSLRDRLEKSILKFEGAQLNGHKTERLPTVTNLCFEDLSGNGIIRLLQKDIAVSSGSACSSGSTEPSHVLMAMGVNKDLAAHALRFSLGKFNTSEEVDFVIERVGLALKEIKEFEKLKN